ncbi:unnamed protein product [Mytilus edulis]|uniref:Uncharacterized protein n=1 Tax=Mytilus edulis TaxID=6550 RepID=A0A8S3TMK1_MYTED|nr:unnamed protein product [Mytilus edulis]
METDTLRQDDSIYPLNTNKRYEEQQMDRQTLRQDDSYIPSKYKQRHEGGQMDRQTLRQDDSIYPLNTNKDMKSNKMRGNRWTDTLRQDDSYIPSKYKYKQRHERADRWTDRHSDKMILIYPLNTNKDMKSNRWTDRHSDKMILIYPLNTRMKSDRWTE